MIEYKAKKENYMSVLERFLKYISIDTTSFEDAEEHVTKGQFILAKLLEKELQDLKLDFVHYDKKHCYVYGILKGDSSLPKIGFVSHLDTSSAVPGNNIKPNIIKNYDGKPRKLNENILLSSEDFPDLKNHQGKTLVTTDGTTLLGADDKAGIAEIMTMLEYFSTHDKKHGDIYICFTPNEEIGIGVEHLNYELFNPDFAYTVDGSDLGEFSYENFNAASAVINIKGVSTHTGYAKDKMVNALVLANLINAGLPAERPENTEGKEGFFHLEKLNGTVTEATMKYIIRDFDKDNFQQRKETLQRIVENLNEEYNSPITLTIKDTYRNMFEVIEKESSLITGTLDSIKSLGIEPNVLPIRGGTDGTDISYAGIPCPNLGAGGHNFHSVYEYVAVEDMEKTSEILVALVQNFAKEDTNKTLKK